MTWNEKKYEQGFADGDVVVRASGIDEAIKAHRLIGFPDDVNEYEVGFASAIQLFREQQAK